MLIVFLVRIAIMCFFTGAYSLAVIIVVALLWIALYNCRTFLTRNSPTETSRDEVSPMLDSLSPTTSSIIISNLSHKICYIFIVFAMPLELCSCILCVWYNSAYGAMILTCGMFAVPLEIFILFVV